MDFASYLIRVLAAVFLGALILLTVTGAVWMIATTIWLIYPKDTLECPNGSERWGRMVAGHMAYACFALSDQRGAVRPVPTGRP